MAIITADTLLSAVGYAAGEIIDIQQGATVTVDATPATRPGTMQALTRGKLRLVNASTTTPIVLTLNAASNDFSFEQNGIFEVRGAPISLGSATGSASETFSLSSAPLNVIPYPSLVEVETAAGSGEYWPYFVVTTVGKPVVWATTEFCAVAASGRVLFWNATTRVLTAGNGTNGSLLPAGANVRIPNIYIDSLTTSATPNLRTQIDLNPSGTIDTEWCAFSDRIFFSVSTFKKIRLVHTGFAGELVLQNANVTEYTEDHVSVQPDTEQTTTAQLYRANGINGPLNLNKVVVLTAGLVTQNNPSQVANNLQDFQSFNDCVFARRDGRDAGTDEAFNLQSAKPGLQINGLSVIGGQLECLSLSDVTIVDFGHADSLGTAQLTTNAQRAIDMTNCSNFKALGVTNAGVAACRNEMFSVDAQSSNVQIFNVNYNCGNNCLGLGSNADLGFEVYNSNLTNLRGDQFLLNASASWLNTAGKYRNIRATLGSGTFIANDASPFAEINPVVGSADRFMMSAPPTLVAFSAAGGYCFANLFDIGLTPAQGNLMAGPFSENASATLTGAAFYNQIGSIFLAEINDAIEVESLFSIVAITSFVNTAPTWTYTQGGVQSTNTTTAPTNLTAEFRVRTPSGTYGAYQTLGAANLSGAIAALTGYDSDVGLYFQLRLTATTADTTRAIHRVYMRTNVDSGYAAPDARLTLLGPNPTDVTTLYRSSDDVALAVLTGAGEHSISGAASNFNENVYFIRRTSGGQDIVSTESMPISLKVGDNGDIALFFGAEVQLAQSSDVSAIKALVDSYLDAAISSRQSETAAAARAATSQAEHDATQAAIAAIAIPTAAANASAVRTELADDLTKLDEIHVLRGLNAAKPVSHTPSAISATGISLAVSGDGTTSSTVQRV